MSQDQNTPLISKTAFCCPHCGAFTTQFWFKAFGGQYNDELRTPRIPTPEQIESVRANREAPEDAKQNFIDWGQEMLLGKPFIEKSEDSPYNPPIINNLNVSRCYNCKDITVWVHDRIVYPSEKIGIAPNVDLPEQIKVMFDEARAIVTESPKGAAALLRLCLQHLCIELGGAGKNLDSDIAELVSKGLNPLVQKSLDVVRVVGNESVHPGEIDLNDDRETALKLFGLVNLIAEQMISHPKNVDELYSKLPERKLEGIGNRDKGDSSGNDT